MYRPIRDYAVIGDGRTAALVSREGSIDWLCLPRFDGPSVFGAILDARQGGRFAVRPTATGPVTRRYVGETNVLETTFTTGEGVLRLTDVLAVTGEEEKRRALWPEHLLIRTIEALDGEPEVEVVFDPRPGYGRQPFRLRERGGLGFFCTFGAQALALRSEVPLAALEGGAGLGGRVRLRRGDRRLLSMAFAAREPLVVPPLGAEADARVEQSLRWWRAWAGGCRYEGPYREAVIRSALALKLLVFAPSGAVVAAPTTSLPERPGGDYNWDYRYCWLRDSAMTLRALLELGFMREGESFLSWLLHATQLTWPELRVMYDVYGRTRLPERVLDHLEGYAGSRPVRTGNGAAEQLQLDVYGQVAAAAFELVRHGGRLDRVQARRLARLGKAICRLWEREDAGIWESRAAPRHHVESMALCWVGLDRLLKLHEEGHLEVPAGRLEAERDRIRARIESEGYSESLRSYVSVPGGEEVDASLLLLALYDYCAPDAPRMRSTVERIRERLGRNGLLYRTPPGDPGSLAGEGAFGICSFWAVEWRARAGDRRGAQAEFEQLLPFGNDVGLFAEEIDPDTGDALGNFPQAFTHVGLINAALALEEGGESGGAEEWRSGRR